MSNQATQTEEIVVAAVTQFELSIEMQEKYEYCVSRVDPIQCGQKELNQNIEPLTMTNMMRTPTNKLFEKTRLGGHKDFVRESSWHKAVDIVQNN